MKTPIKTGKLYVQYDNNNKPIYCFRVKGDRIIEYSNLTEAPQKTIVLPIIKEDEPFVPLNKEKVNTEIAYEEYKNYIDEYCNGNIVICRGCFECVKEAKIIVPFENSIKLEYDCFDEDANITFQTNNKLALKQIDLFYDTGFSYEEDSRVIVADKNLYGSYGWKHLKCSIVDFNRNKYRYKVANLKLENYKEKESEIEK